MKRILYILTLGILASACEIPFEIEQEGLPKIYLQAIATQEGITALPLYAAPIGPGDVPEKDFQLSLLVNGTPVDALSPIAQGAQVTVRVSAPGMQSAEGSTTLVAAPVIANMEWEQVQADSIDATRVHLTLQDAPQTDEHYAIQIVCNSSVTYLDGNTSETVFYTVPGYILSASESGSIDLEDFVQVNYKPGSTLGGSDYAPLTLLESKHFKGREYSFYLNSYDQYILSGIRDSMPQGDTGIAGGGIVSGGVGGELPGGGEGFDPSLIPVYAKSEYYIFMYRLSPEFYYYAKALYQSNFDFLSNMGLTPANFTYSNVAGGLGFVGSASASSASKLVIEKSLKD